MKLFRNNQQHSFHLVDPSPWPFIGGMSALMLTFGGVLFMNGFKGGFSLLELGFVMLFYTMFCWWRDVIREGTYEGQHTASVQAGLKMGMILFIVSEVMFFFGIFWAFFHSSFNPSIALGGVWPPAFLTILDPWKIPFFNTVILVTSGATVTWAHHAILLGSKTHACISLLLTLLLAIFFLELQTIEFYGSPFTISDGVYASTFFMATGFHGLHVFIGFVFLIVCTVRLYLNHYTREHHLGFEAAAWYWHFVDVVWLFLFLTIYWWGA
jgi:cytochrome c oxidase subunit 3